MLYRKLNVVLAISSALSVNALAATVQHSFNDNNQLLSASSSQSVVKPEQMKNLSNEFGKNTVQWFEQSQPNEAQLNLVVDKTAQIQKAGKRVFAKIASKHGYIDNGASDSVVAQIHDTGKGPIIVKYKQQVNGVDVIGSEINIIMNQQLGLVASTGTFATINGGAQSQSSTLLKSSKSAIIQAYLESNVNVNASDLDNVVSDNGFDTYKVVNQSDFVDGKSWAIDNAAAKFVYYPTGRGVEAAYMINVSTVDSQTQESTMQGYFISARDLRVLHKGSLQANHEYRYKVYADDTSPYRPFDTPTSIEASPYPNGVDPHAYGLYTDHLVEDQYVSVINTGISTNDPWLEPYQIVADGNNVRAMADVVAPEGFTIAKEGDPQRDFYLTTSAPGTFNYSYNYNLPASDPHNIRSALTQLFYVNNYMHNIWYDAGFDEQSGNAQKDNYGRGGLGNDSLEARVDFNGANNASMMTPPDGQTPVMRMYTWGLYELLFDVRGLIGQEEGDIFSPDRFGRSVFGPSTFEMIDDPDTEIVENELAYAFDDEGVAADLCEPAINAEEIAGKIAVISRGECSFLQKSLNAQKAGAVGYFVYNHVKQGQENSAGQIGGVINMGLGPNDDASDVTIPGVFLSYEDAENILLSLDAGNSVTIDVVVKTDQNHSAFDTTIVSHEWGHYLTNRLIHNGFGLMQWQGASMGEGWSDFIAMMLQLKESDRNILGNELFQGHNPMSTFVGRNLIGNISFKEGIRRYPYTTDMNINPLTLGHIAFSAELPREVGTYYSGQYIPNNEVHAAGEVWASALWDVYIALHNERRDLSFDMIETRMKEYLVASLKVTPYWPTYIEARDALLAVTAATDEKDFDIMVRAFAKRGFGLGAVAPERTDALFEQVVESFATSYPAFSVEDISADYQFIGDIGAYCDLDESFDVGETVKITMKLKDLSREPFTGTKAIINTIDDVTISQNGVVRPDNVLNIDFSGEYGSYVDFSFEMTLHSAEPMSTVRFDLAFENTEVDVLMPPAGSAWMSAQTDILANQNNLTRFENNIAVDADWLPVTENVSVESYGVAVFPWLLDSKFGSDALDIRQEQMFWGGASPTRAFTALESPEVEVNESGEFKFEFFHIHEFEVADYRAAESLDDAPWIREYWDGGVIEVSVNGGEWQDVTSLNAHMSSPYTNVLHGTFTESEAKAQNPLGYRMAYTGSTNPKGELVTITIPEGQVNGKRVKVRFAIGTDEQSPTLGWFIDDFEFFNTVKPAFSIAVAEQGESCGNRAPMINTVNRITVDEKDSAGNQSLISTSASAIEFDNEAVTFTWEQLSGPTAEFTQSNDGNLSFVSPIISRNSLLIFKVTATDASGNEKSETVEIIVRDVNVAPTSQGADMTVKEGALVVINSVTEDLDGDSLTFNWQQVSGDAVEFDGAKSDAIEFVAPNITETTTVSFEMTASDSDKSTTSTYTVTIEPYSSNVSSSGSFGWILGVFTLMFAIRQRYALTLSNNK
ncbi:M36 family metallopeptidase [Thalassotalea crassostreae]|uniref:M36 family metallopeptidase n=1 Tax=Thalassotalea crassostreae TaxID=1763536 RepID=UPI000838B0B4|nr:M36 family metallopeptidase [Thalassotalea crassostreae]